MVDSEDWTVRMHLCRMIPRVHWSPATYAEVLRFSFQEAHGTNKFVQAWALDALAQLAVHDESVFGEVFNLLREALESGPPSVRVRARIAYKRLTEEPQSG